MESDCLFCKISQGKTDTEILYENDTLVVFRDIHPAAPIHLLIVPKKHIRSVNDLTAAEQSILSEMVMAAKEAPAPASRLKVSLSRQRTA